MNLWRRQLLYCQYKGGQSTRCRRCRPALYDHDLGRSTMRNGALAASCRARRQPRTRSGAFHPEAINPFRAGRENRACCPFWRKKTWRKRPAAANRSSATKTACQGHCVESDQTGRSRMNRSQEHHTLSRDRCPGRSCPCRSCLCRSCRMRHRKSQPGGCGSSWQMRDDGADAAQRRRGAGDAASLCQAARHSARSPDSRKRNTLRRPRRF
jgi:hypothetical protein